MTKAISGTRKEKKAFSMNAVLDTFSLAAVLQYIAYRFLQSTMFVIYFSNLYKIMTLAVLLVFGGARYTRLIIEKFKAKKTIEEKRKFIAYCAFAWCLALPFIYVGWKHDYKFLIFLPVCCMCLYDMEAEKILRAFAFAIGTLLAATVLCCLSGTVRNLVYIHEESGGWVVGAYGIINTTDFASYFTFVLLAIWCGFYSRKTLNCISYAGLVFVLSGLVYLLTKSRTVLLCGIMISAFVLLQCFNENVLNKKQKYCKLKTLIFNLIKVIFPIIGVCILILVFCHGNHQHWATQINQLLSDRLEESWKAYQEYGVHLFGNSIESIHGNGATIIGNRWSTGIRYIDTAYVMVAIRYGIAVLGIIAGLWVWLTSRSLRCEKPQIALAMTVIAFHAFSEARFMDANYNIFLLMPFCAFGKEKDEKLITLSDSKKRIMYFGRYIVFLGGVFLILPKALSWFRTFFYLKEWNDGTAAINSLFVCYAMVLLIWLLWKSMTLYSAKKKRMAILISAGVIIALIGTGININNTIDIGLQEQDERLGFEEEIIQQVKGAATQPVYAAEASELYERRFGGLSNHIFTTDELYRGGKGTIITDKKTEAHRILRSGGMYTALSEWSGLYTYDPAVIETLEKEGYIWESFYTGKHVCNLADTALFNNAEYIDGLVLNGPERIITSNCETDQFSARYKVSISMELKSCGEDDLVCVVEVLGEAGETIICQEELSQSDFDSDGKCMKTIDYSLIYSMPKVSYGITVQDGVTMIVDDISWQRVS